MTTRELISDDGIVRRYQVFDGTKQIGTDVEIIPTLEQVNAATIRSRLLQAFAANAAYLGLAAPTNAQNTAHLRRVTQELSALIRLVLELLDTTDGT